MKFKILCVSLLLSLTALLHAAPLSLFNGQTLDGWEGETNKVWRVVDGLIIGGSLAGNPQNEFLTTKKKYRNFILKLEYKLTGTEGFVNSGVQFRSKRIPNPPNEISGYQADIGAGYSGCLYDESRRKTMLVKPDKALVESLEKPGDWNTYEIRAEEQRIQLFLNGTRTVDFTEREPGIDMTGVIALQIHGNCKAEVAFRNITIDALPDLLVPDEQQILQRFGEGSPAQIAALKAFEQNRFAPASQETIVFAGQTNLVREQKSGELEALLSTGFPNQTLRFRSMAWEADTVYEQWRDLNFGPWKAQLDAANTTTVIAQFGQVEAFDGPSKLPEFSAAYHRLIDQFVARTPRLILISPMPFEKSQYPHVPNLLERNADVKTYADAVRKIARDRGAIYVDLFSALSERPKNAPPLTENGMHLTPAGLREVATIIAKQLGAPADAKKISSDLREAIIEKNRLWSDCWRPANWSFVYGDRVSQMFGKPSVIAPSLRESFEAHKPLIARWDERIRALARGEKSAPIPSAALPGPPSDTTKPASPEEEMAAFTLAEGYEINLFASEDLGVAKPTQMAWDEKGRLYVACSSTYPQTIPGVKPSDYILVLEDTKGTGRADKSHKFAEGLTMVQGVEPGNGGIYVCDFDQLLHLKDTNGDGRADETKVLFSGFGVGDTHQLINSISHGPDGSLWFSQGLHAFSKIETPWGLSKLEKAGLWQLNPRTLKTQSFFNGGKAGHNCWGVAFDDYNQVFHKSGDRPDGYYSVPGLTRVSNPDEYHPVGPLFMTSPKTTGLEIIGTQALPDEVQGCAFIGGYFGSVLELHRFIDDGAGFRTEQLPKLLRSSDPSFRPVDVNIGPDGAMYIADWFNPVIGHYQASYADPRRDRTHGRIWRITAKGKKTIKQPDLSAMNAADLLEQLRSPERWTRQQAKRLLFDSDSQQVVAAADAFVKKITDEHLLLEVAGVFQAHQTSRPALLKRLLSANDARVRAYGTRVIAQWQKDLPDTISLLSKAVQDSHPRVRLEAVVAASYIETLESVGVALHALEFPRDKFVDYALKQTVRSLKPVWAPATQNKAVVFKGTDSQMQYLRQITAGDSVVAHPGQAVYEALCLNCHQPGGKGLPGVYPPLEGSEWVAGDKTALIKILLHGLAGPITVAGQDYGKAVPIPMPPMGLDDQQTADVLSYIRSHFGQNAPAVTAEEVKAVRRAHAERSTFWLTSELKP